MELLTDKETSHQSKPARFRTNIIGDDNIINHQNARLNKVEFNITGNNNFIMIHPGSLLNNVSFNIYGDKHKIIIGDNVTFNERGSIWAEDNDCLISIGRDCSFEGVHLSATEPESRLIIGNDCMFSYDIDIRTGDSHSIINRKTGKRINYAKNIKFGDHIWVASHCIFTKGAEIPSHSIVGTGSLVNKAFTEEHVLIAGRPAKILKTDVDWLRERIYTETNVSKDAEPVTE